MVLWAVRILGVAIIITTYQLQDFSLVTAKRVLFTPNCTCPSKNKFPVSNDTRLTFCGYERGPECVMHRGYICEVEQADKEAMFQTPDCVDINLFCVPLHKLERFRACGGKTKCQRIPNCNKTIAAALYDMENWKNRQATS
jgi:hypothetical protein